MSEQKELASSTARAIEYSIIGLCIISLLFIFQPFNLRLYGIGAGLVVLGGLAFNLVPLCQARRPLKDIVKVALIVLIILVVVALLAMGAALLYGVYVENTRPG